MSDLAFTRDLMRFPALSAQHYRVSAEHRSAQVRRAAEMLKSDPEKLAQFRREFEALAAEYFEDNMVRKDFLLSRASRAQAAQQ